MYSKLLLVVVCASLLQFSNAASQNILISGEIYTFWNRDDLGFLTFINKANIVDTDVWRESPTQKWKIVKGFISDSYMLKPTAADTQAIYQYGREVKVAGSGFGLSSSQYWNIQPTDSGYYLLKNSYNEECLTANGLGKKVSITPCRNTGDQQWALHRI